jgi:hypothetical protein
LIKYLTTFALSTLIIFERKKEGERKTVERTKERVR